MKKLTVLVICIVLTLLLPACGGNTSDNQGELESENTATPVSTPSGLIENGEILVSWKPDYSKFAIEESNATIALQATVSGLNPSQISSSGVDLYDSDGNLLTSRREPATFSDSDNLIDIWYDVNADLNYTLSSNTAYIFTMYVVIDGTAYTSEKHSFTTNATSQPSQADETTNIESTPTPTQVESTPTPTFSYPPLLNGMQQNGQYKLTLYEAGKRETSDGTMVSADLVIASTVTDADAQNLLSTEPSAQYFNYGSYEEIAWSGGFLRRNVGESLWQEYYPSDAAKTDVYSSGQIFIPHNAQFLDNMTSIMLGSIRNVSSLDELFHVSFMGMEFDYSSIDVQVAVSDGVITIVDMYYTP